MASHVGFAATRDNAWGTESTSQIRSAPDANYLIQSSTDLLTWVDEGTVIAGDGAIKSLLEPVSTVTHKFFRVVQL